MTSAIASFVKKANEAALASLKFDYATLEDQKARKEAQKIALRIRDNLSRAKEAVFSVGHDLIVMKDEIMHGSFKHWLEAELPKISARTAQNYMNAYRLFDKDPDAVKQLDITAVYELAAKSAPAEIVEEALEQAKSGQPPTPKEIKAKIKEAKQAAQPEAKKPELKVIESTPIDGRKQAAAGAMALLQKHLDPATLAEFVELAMAAEDAFLPAIAGTLKEGGSLVKSIANEREAPKWRIRNINRISSVHSYSWVNSTLYLSI